MVSFRLLNKVELNVELWSPVIFSGDGVNLIFQDLNYLKLDIATYAAEIVVDLLADDILEYTRQRGQSVYTLLFAIFGDFSHRIHIANPQHERGFLKSLKRHDCQFVIDEKFEVVVYNFT